MPAQLDWRVGDDEREWQPLESAPPLPPPWYRRVLRRIPRWVWGALLVAVLAATLGGYLTVRRARFYRRTDRGWLHTSPQLDFWQPAVETLYANLTVLGHERDLPHAGPMLDHISNTAVQICEIIGCAPDVHLVVDISARREIGTDFPRYEEGPVRVDSPWLLGIPIEQTLDQAYYTLLTRATVQAVVNGVLSGSASDAPSLSPLQRALVDELTAWYTARDTSAAPLLERIVERHGEEVLPGVLRSTSTVRSADEFLAAWLGGSPSSDDPSKRPPFSRPCLTSSARRCWPDVARRLCSFSTFPTRGITARRPKSGSISTCSSWRAWRTYPSSVSPASNSRATRLALPWTSRRWFPRSCRR